MSTPTTQEKINENRRQLERCRQLLHNTPATAVFRRTGLTRRIANLLKEQAQLSAQRERVG